MDDMPGMNGAAASSTSAITDMVMATMSGESAAPTTPMLMPVSPSSTVPAGMSMASEIATSPQAGLITDMADLRNMCELPGMERMCETQTPVVIGVCAALLALATIAVILRLLARKLSRVPFWWDDVMILVSLAFAASVSAIILVSVENGVGKHFETVPEAQVNNLFKLFMANTVMYTVTVTLIRISILIFYYRIFGVNNTFRLTTLLTSLVCCVWCIVFVFVNIFHCSPVEAQWIRPYPRAKCLDNNATVIGSGVTNVLLDLVILVLPLPLIWNLALSVKQRVTLTAVFLVGVFICIAAIVRVWSAHNIDQTDVSWSYARPVIWSAVEIGVAITCACLPTLQPIGLALLNCCRRRPSTYYNSTTSGRHRPPARHHARFSSSPSVSLEGRKLNYVPSSPERNPSQESYPLEKGGFATPREGLVTSAWASKEDLSGGGGFPGADAEEGGKKARPRHHRQWSSVNGAGGQVHPSSPSQWGQEIAVWPKGGGIHVTSEIEIERGSQESALPLPLALERSAEIVHVRSTSS